MLLNVEELITMKENQHSGFLNSHRLAWSILKKSHHTSPKQFLINLVSMLIRPNGKHSLGSMRANVILLTLYVILFTFLSLMNKLKCPLIL